MVGGVRVRVNGLKISKVMLVGNEVIGGLGLGLRVRVRG